MLPDPTARTPVAPGLWTSGALPALIGGRHLASGRIVFPMPQGAAAAGHAPVTLRRDGTLWSFTVQRFAPKSPPYSAVAGFAPYAIGYVELAGEVIVEARLDTQDFAGLHVGQPVELVLVPFGPDKTTFAFRPVAGAAQ